LVTLYDGVVRDRYHTNAKVNSIKAVGVIDDLIDQGADLETIRGVSQDASKYRQDLRTETQGKLTPSGRRISEVLEEPRYFDDLVEKYTGELGKEKADADVFRLVAEKSGSSRTSIDNFAKASKGLGVLGTIAGVGFAADAIANAPEGQKLKVAAQEGGGAFGGAIGSLAGGALGAGAVILLASNPVGWVFTAAVIGASFIGSASLGWGGSELGQHGASELYDWSVGD
jgi:hypothetical protein